MAATWKTVRIFISSTFRDMHAERDLLVHDVFLELKERCARRCLHLIDVDLRWGVTEEEERQGKVLEICFDEIDRCRPFFIGLLGERYGPSNYYIPDNDKFQWVRELEAAESGHSVTALEFYHAVLRDHSMGTRAFFYFRDPSFLTDPVFLSEVSAERQRDFVPESQDAARRLKALKDEVRERFPAFENYPCRYGGLDEKGQVKLIDLEAFGKRVVDDLWEAIKIENPQDEAPSDDLAIERAHHEAFIEGRSERFIGRREVLAQLTKFADDPVKGMLVVTGSAGCGKSALLANFARQYTDEHPQDFVLVHFIGVSPGSTDIRRTLVRLCRELARHSGVQERIPTDYSELRQTFFNFLEHAATHGKVLLVLDALNQLDESHYAHALDWLPRELPSGSKIIVSTTAESDCLQALRSRHSSLLETGVDALTELERKEIVRQTLAVYRKHLDERPEQNQMALLLSKHGSESPLYLTVACEEMRVFGDFERVTERINGLPAEIEPLFEQVLERIEATSERFDPGKGRERVRDALSLLECSRYGLLESEMLELLAREGEEHLPQAIWARLYRSLKFYLRPSGDAGENDRGLLDFFHGQLAKATRQRYFRSESEEASSHQRLARYFRRKADPNEDGRWSANYPRGLTELPHHLLTGKRYDDLFQIARDETFLLAQASTFTDEPGTQLDTLQKALAGAAEIDDAAKMAEFMLAHVRRLMKLAEGSPLAALCEGRLEQALNLADMIFSGDKDKGVLWFLFMAWHLKGQERNDDARKILTDLAAENLSKLEDPLDGDDFFELVILALCALSEVDEFSFLKVLEKLLDGKGHLKVCQNLLARHQWREKNSQIGRELNLAFQVAEKVSDEHWRACILSEIARTQAASGYIAEAAMIFESALKTARNIQGYYRAATLKEIAKAQAACGQFEVAFSTVSEIDDVYAFDRACALNAIAKSLIALGKVEKGEITFAEAIRVARQADEEDLPSHILREVATAQAEAGRIDAAIKTAREIKVEYDRVTALRAVLQGEATAGLFEEVIETAGEIGDEFSPIDALREVARAQVLKGKVEGAKTFDEAIKTAKELRDERSQGYALRWIVEAQATVGNIVEAIQTARAIRTGWREDALMAIAKAQAAAGQVVEAGATLSEAMAVRDVDLGHHREVALREIVKALAKAGRFDEALATVSKLLHEHRADALTGIGRAQAAVGRDAEALETVKLIDDEDDLTRALTEIAETQTKVGSILEAGKTFVEATRLALRAKLSERSTALLCIVNAQAATGRVEEAIETAREISDERFPEGALRSIVTVQGLAGRIDEAIETATEINEKYRVHALVDIVKAQAGAGRVEDAIRTLSEIGSDYLREEPLIEIAKAWAVAGEVDEAVNTIRSICNEYTQTRGLREVAVAQASVGNATESGRTFARAIETARTINSDSSRESALRDIAEAQATTGQFEAAINTIRDLVNPINAISSVAEVFVSKGAKASFKQLLAPASYYGFSVYKTCGFLARLYSDDGAAIDRIAALVL